MRVLGEIGLYVKGWDCMEKVCSGCPFERKAQEREELAWRLICATNSMQTIRHLIQAGEYPQGRAVVLRKIRRLQARLQLLEREVLW